MSNPSDRPWTEEERYSLLTEILKKASIPSSHLVRMIKDFRISPSWGDIPLPPGRSLNSCQMAFYNMCQQPTHPPPQLAAPYPPRPDMPGPPTAPMDPGPMRKRPLYPADKPALAPRAIQPRPAVSTASYSSESGASAQLSPQLEHPAAGEPPRKRGRPSKAETERRKAAAEARGDPYPPLRRAGSSRVKIPPSPTSPAVGAAHTPYSASTLPQAPLAPKPVTAPYEGPVGRPMAPSPPPPPPPPPPPLPPTAHPSGDELREMPTRSTDANLRELPRPTEMLPSPRMLQLGPGLGPGPGPGPRDTFPRLNSNPSERAYGSFRHERFSPPDSGRRDSLSGRTGPSPQPFAERRTSTARPEKHP